MLNYRHCLIHARVWLFHVLCILLHLTRSRCMTFMNEAYGVRRQADLAIIICSADVLVQCSQSRTLADSTLHACLLCLPLPSCRLREAALTPGGMNTEHRLLYWLSSGGCEHSIGTRIFESWYNVIGKLIVWQFTCSLSYFSNLVPLSSSFQQFSGCKHVILFFMVMWGLKQLSLHTYRVVKVFHVLIFSVKCNIWGGVFLRWGTANVHRFFTVGISVT